MGIKIIRTDYEKAGFGTLLMREIVGRMVCAFTINIGYLIILFNPERRGLHDKIAGTIVVKKLRGQAGANQLASPRRALVQSLGGPASTAVTQVLERVG